MTKVSVYLKPEVERDIKLLASHYGVKQTEIFNRALTAYLESEGKALEFARRQQQEREQFRQNEGA